MKKQSTKEMYQQLLRKAYKNEDLTLKELALIAANPIDKVVRVSMINDERDGFLKYKIDWENNGYPSVGKIEVE